MLCVAIAIYVQTKLNTIAILHRQPIVQLQRFAIQTTLDFVVNLFYFLFIHCSEQRNRRLSQL